MAIFPDCTFKVFLEDGAVTAGKTVKGELILQVPQAIPRAEHIDLFFRTIATAGYGGGKNRTVVQRNMFMVPMHVDLPKNQPLSAGEHRWPFALDIPAWLPPSYSGLDCSISSAIDLRLDVDWAVDPKAHLAPVVVMPPQWGHATPLTTRSPNMFHESIVVEVTLDSSIVAHDQPVTGRIALRGGHNARFDALVVSLFSTATIRMSNGDRRRGNGLSIRIPKGNLQHGESVPFAFPGNSNIPPTFRNGFIDHDVVLRVEADIPWATDPAFDVALQVLPRGSTIEADATPAGMVGASRLRQLASAMSSATGLPAGRLPTLIEGPVGPLRVALADGPRAGQIGVDIDMTFPDLDLGLWFRPLGLLDGFRQSPFLPTAIGSRYLLKLEKGHAPAPSDEAMEAFIKTVLTGLEGAADIRFSDHHLGLHYVLSDDGSQAMTSLATVAVERAKLVAHAISKLPFPPSLSASAPAWESTAAEQTAFLVPHVPAIHGVVFRARVLGGESRAMNATIRTVWRKSVPIVVVDLDLREAPMAQTTLAELENETGLAPVRTHFPVMHANGAERVTLETAGWIQDPRALLPAIELFFDAVLDARGERRTDSPYR